MESRALWRPLARLPPAWLSCSGRTRESVKPLPRSNDTANVCCLSRSGPQLFSVPYSFVPGADMAPEELRFWR
jgi:hypothetical protein